MNGRKQIGRNFLEAHHRARFVERPFRSEHPFHQAGLGPREHVADAALMLHRGAQRVLDTAAVESVDGLKLVERDDDARLAQIAEAPGQREHLGGEARDVAIGPGGGELHRHPHRSRRVGLDPQLRLCRGDGFFEPAARLVPTRLHRQQRPGVALEEREIGAVAADRDVGGQGAAAADGPQRLPDEGRLAVPSGRDEEDLLARRQVAHEPVQLVDAIDERCRGHDLAVYEWVFHYVNLRNGYVL